jgi:hypothetical protein
LVIADVQATETPILLVHGVADNQSVFAVLGRALRRLEHPDLLVVNVQLSDVGHLLTSGRFTHRTHSGERAGPG